MKNIVSVSPHITSNVTTRKIMLDVLIALSPALVASVILFGWRALLVTAVCVAFAVLSEWGFEKICRRDVTVGDLSAAVTGVILAFNLPVGIPLWQAALGSIVAVVVVKQLFGGIGQNFANPAATARVILLVAFAGTMTDFTSKVGGVVGQNVDAISSATVLSRMDAGAALPKLTDLLLGNQTGCIGETCVVALVLGGLYLIARGVITWHAPVAFVGTVFVFTWILGGQPVYQVCSGGLLLGAFFMATDYTTTQPTKGGRFLFGLGCGLITVLIRTWGNYAEGVSFSILLMNILTPYISKWTMHKPVGGVKA